MKVVRQLGWLLFSLLVFTSLFFHSLTPIYAGCEVRDYSNPDEYQKAIEECQQEIDVRTEAHTKNKADLASLERSLANTKKLIESAQSQINNLEEEIFDQEVDLEYQKEILAIRVRGYYKKSQSYSPLLLLLASTNAIDLLRELSYRKIATDEDKEVIMGISQDISQLVMDKEEIEEKKAWLDATKNSIDQQAQTLGAEVERVEDYFSEVSGKIAELTVQQQAILAARSGSFITSVGSVPIGSDYDASIAGFESGAPSGYFAVFSFGAYTHRKGMSQYGAYGRANDNKTYDEILHAYYSFDRYEDRSGITIKVNDGNGVNQGSVIWSGSLEDYVKRIYEIPSSWPMASLESQAIAARSYALRVTNNGEGSICANEYCQAFKTDPKGEEWESAVISTSGKVMMLGGEIVKAFYSSTSGGYLTTMGWDTTDGSGSGDWTSRAWESKAGSPWFYKAWYREGYRNDSNNCGRKPWMSGEEMADILNAWLVLNKGEGNGMDTGRIVPETINQCPIGGQSGDPYSMAELRNKLSNPVTSISGEPRVSHDGNGNTTTVTFQTNRGALAVPGYEFKERFNGRAPGYLSIPQKGFAFFNIEKK